jgi:hypothetical protein
VKSLIEELALVAAVDEDGEECPVEIGAAFDPDGTHCLDRGEHFAGPDRQPRGAQGAAEIHDVREKAALALGAGTG